MTTILRRTLLLFILLCVGVFLPSCKNRSNNNNQISSLSELFELGTAADALLTDSTSSWQQIKDASLQLADAIVDAASDEFDLKKRMAGQEYGYAFMVSVVDKYMELKASGQAIPDEEINSIINPIQGAISCWFYEPNEEMPHLWKDHFYVSNKTADKPVKGYFHIMLTLPTKDEPEPSLHIFYPESAESSPALIFRDNLGDSIVDDDFDMKNLIPLNDWFERNENGDGMPMAAFAEGEVVKKMLTCPVVYLLFRSSETEHGDPGELEVARLDLEPLQIAWQELVYE